MLFTQQFIWKITYIKKINIHVLDRITRITFIKLCFDLMMSGTVNERTTRRNPFYQGLTVPVHDIDSFFFNVYQEIKGIMDGIGAYLPIYIEDRPILPVVQKRSAWDRTVAFGHLDELVDVLRKDVPACLEEPYQEIANGLVLTIEGIVNLLHTCQSYEWLSLTRQHIWYELYRMYYGKTLFQLAYTFLEKHVEHIGIDEYRSKNEVLVTMKLLLECTHDLGY